jgi:hypothetical protein
LTPQVDAQLWTPTAGKFPDLPVNPKPVRDPLAIQAKKQLGSVKDQKIRKLTAKIGRRVDKKAVELV